MQKKRKKPEPRRVMVNLTGEEFELLEEAQQETNVPRSFSALIREAVVEVYG